MGGQGEGAPCSPLRPGEGGKGQTWGSQWGSRGGAVGDGRERRALGGLKYLSTSAGQSGPGFNLLGSFSIPKSTRGHSARKPLPQGRAFHSRHGGGVQAYALLLPINNSGWRCKPRGKSTGVCRQGSLTCGCWGKTRKEGHPQRSREGLKPGLHLCADRHTTPPHLYAVNSSRPRRKPLAFSDPSPGGQKASDAAVCHFPGSREPVRGGGGQRYPRTRIWRGDTAWSV